MGKTARNPSQKAVMAQESIANQQRKKDDRMKGRMDLTPSLGVSATNETVTGAIITEEFDVTVPTPSRRY